MSRFTIRDISIRTFEHWLKTQAELHLVANQTGGNQVVHVNTRRSERSLEAILVISHRLTNSPIASSPRFGFDFATSNERDAAAGRAASRRGAPCRDIFSTAEPTNDHAVCIFPFRRYEVCGMILYAKSSLELIVNNRIGKVGIRPDGRPSSAHPITAGPTPRNPSSVAPPPAGRLPSSLRNASHLAPESARCRSAARPSVRPSVCLSVHPSVRPCCSTLSVSTYVRTYLRTYTYVPARHFRAEYKRVYVHARRSHTPVMYKCGRPVPARTAHYLPTYYYV